MPSSWGDSWGAAWGSSWGVRAALPAAVVTAIRPSGGFWHEELKHAIEGRKSWRKRLEEQRIQVLAINIIERVADRQAITLEADEYKRFEELERELELKGLTWEARYLEALNERRETLITEEIGKLLRIRRDEEDVTILLSMMASLI